MLFSRLPIQHVFTNFLKKAYIPKLSNVFCRQMSSKPEAHYILFPEVPEVSEKDLNKLMETGKDLPVFDGFSKKQICLAMIKINSIFETKFFELERQIKDCSIPITYKSVLEELDNLNAMYINALEKTNMFLFLDSSLVTKEIMEKIGARFDKAFTTQYASESLAKACDEIYSTEQDLTDIQHRLLRKCLLYIHYNGITSSKKQFFEDRARSVQLQYTKYNYKLSYVNNGFSYHIINPSNVKGMPLDILYEMANGPNYLEGPWSVTFQPHIFDSFVEHCPDRDIRRNIYNAKIMRCAPKNWIAGVGVNEELIAIRDLREGMAGLLGYQHFGELCMETQMAGNIDIVLQGLSVLEEPAKKRQKEDLASLKTFMQGHGVTSRIEPFDVPYWRRRHLEEVTQYSVEEIQQYFPLDKVWAGLEETLRSLFGITLKKETVPADRLWHPTDVTFYKVFNADTGVEVGGLYLDPYFRPTKQNVVGYIPVRTRCDALGHTPLAAIIASFASEDRLDENVAPKILNDGEFEDCYLTYQEVKKLFSAMGQAMRQVFQISPYRSVCADAFAEKDNAETAQRFMEFWLETPEVLKSISRHQETGLPAPDDVIACIQQRERHLAGFDLCEELFMCHYDIKLHSDPEHWYHLCYELHNRYKPFEWNPNFHLLCWTPEIIVGNKISTYYSSLWSKMVAANVYAKFMETENKEQLGRKFRDTFLSHGGAVHASHTVSQFLESDVAVSKLLDVMHIE